MKRCLALGLCLLLIFATPLPADAAAPRIVDDAGLLSAEEEALLEKKAAQLSEQYSMDVVIVTVYSLDGKTSEAYADDYFDYNGYGIGDDHSGVLLLLSMEYRDWAISTCGQTIYALTDYAVQDVFSQISGYLADDAYYPAFSAYLDTLEPYFSAYHDGDPIDGYLGDYKGPGSFEHASKDTVIHYDDSGSSGRHLQKLLISFVIGLVVAGIVLLVMRSRMNTARHQHGASSYMRSGSYTLSRHQDMFLYSQVRKVRKQENSSHSGGSSVHRSSSGRSHGGGHGKF